MFLKDKSSVVCMRRKGFWCTARVGVFCLSIGVSDFFFPSPMYLPQPWLIERRRQSSRWSQQWKVGWQFECILYQSGISQSAQQSSQGHCSSPCTSPIPRHPQRGRRGRGADGWGSAWGCPGDVACLRTLVSGEQESASRCMCLSTTSPRLPSFICCPSVTHFSIIPISIYFAVISPPSSSCIALGNRFCFNLSKAFVYSTLIQ